MEYEIEKKVNINIRKNSNYVNFIKEKIYIKENSIFLVMLLLQLKLYKKIYKKSNKWTLSYI